MTPECLAPAIPRPPGGPRHSVDGDEASLREGARVVHLLRGADPNAASRWGRSNSTLKGLSRNSSWRFWMRPAPAPRNRASSGTGASAGLVGSHREVKPLRGSTRSRRERGKFTDEQKVQAAKLVRDVGSISQVAKGLDLTESALRNWVCQAGIDAGNGSEGALTTKEKYASFASQKLLEQNSITVSTSRRVECYGNAVVEELLRDLEDGTDLSVSIGPPGPRAILRAQPFANTSRCPTVAVVDACDWDTRARQSSRTTSTLLRQPSPAVHRAREGQGASYPASARRLSRTLAGSLRPRRPAACSSGSPARRRGSDLATPQSSRR